MTGARAGRRRETGASGPVGNAPPHLQAEGFFDG